MASFRAPFRSSLEPAAPTDVAAPDVAASTVPAAEDFETIRDRARALVDRGAYREAAAAYRVAVDLATAAGETDRADEALCGWGAAETEIGNAATVMPELRRILLRSTVDHNCCLASYTLARGHELHGQIKKALFYARLFRDRAQYVERDGLVSLAHNLLGNLLAVEGREAEAADCYRTALRTTAGAPPTWIAAAEANLGYCLLVASIGTGGVRRSRMREGLRLVYRAIRTFRREGAVQYAMLPHLDLCLAHLELGRPASARRHGERALELAERCDDVATIKNSLYLLGQVALFEGKADLARQRVDELGRFYPEQAGLVNVLMSLDLKQVVNLRA